MIFTRPPLNNRQKDIAKMQCELLYSKFNNDTTTAEGVEFIESMLGGNSAHCAGALKRGLIEGGVLPAPDPDPYQPSSDTEPLTPPAPRTITHRGMIQVKSIGDSRLLGYISTLSPDHFSFESSSTNALNVNFDTDLTGTGTNLNINIEVRFGSGSSVEFSSYHHRILTFRTGSQVSLSWPLPTVAPTRTGSWNKHRTSKLPRHVSHNTLTNIHVVQLCVSHGGCITYDHSSRYFHDY